VRRGGEARW
ncbi:MBL fold metallo-hydrolase, partial [Actinoallomurus iriomotensis]